MPAVPSAHLPPRAAALRLAAWALGALAVGAAVYLLDRPAGSAMLLPPAWQRGPAGAGVLPAVFGEFGRWLPSLVHAFAFSILTALLWPWPRHRAAAACATWAAIDTLAEIGQHPLVAAPLAGWLHAAFDGAEPAAAVARYLSQGSFDPADIAAGLAGAAAAYGLLRRHRVD
jgi:hypothetical protein